MRTRRAMPLLAVALAVGVLGCTAAADPGPRFNDEGLRELTCMAHQTARPGARYTDPDLRRTDETLPLLRYYTANGAKPYCDSTAPTDTDRTWANLYIELGADRTYVEPLLK